MAAECGPQLCEVADHDGRKAPLEPDEHRLRRWQDDPVDLDCPLLRQRGGRFTVLAGIAAVDALERRGGRAQTGRRVCCRGRARFRLLVLRSPVRPRRVHGVPLELHPPRLLPRLLLRPLPQARHPAGVVDRALAEALQQGSPLRFEVGADGVLEALSSGARRAVLPKLQEVLDGLERLLRGRARGDELRDEFVHHPLDNLVDLSHQAAPDALLVLADKLPGPPVLADDRLVVLRVRELADAGREAEERAESLQQPDDRVHSLDLFVALEQGGKHTLRVGGELRDALRELLRGDGAGGCARLALPDALVYLVDRGLATDEPLKVVFHQVLELAVALRNGALEQLHAVPQVLGRRLGVDDGEVLLGVEPVPRRQNLVAVQS
mmetsp:Transcript_36678/g.87121  ORF Transcript_36678/g.87121 Transcript_36678/m.87121 type:complete len:380 (-) Transcript_36678:636-1775(-)